MRLPPEILLASLMVLTTSASAADQSPSVQVETVPLRQQVMTDLVSGYGVVSPDVHSQQAISLPRPGQLVSLLVSPGEVVRKGLPLLEFSTDPTAALAYEQARQGVNFATGEVERIGQLVTQQLATQSQLASARKSLSDAKASLMAQEEIGAGKRVERVMAPFDGVVVAVQAAQGDRLAAGAPVLQLARSGRQRVLLGIEPDDVRRVRTGMSVKVMPVFSPGVAVTGRVVQVFGMINPQTQLVDVMVSVQGDGLMPGTRVRAEIEVARQNDWVVPRSAVLRDEHGAYLFQVANGKAHRINVTTGLKSEKLTAVQGAFTPQLPVVSVGNYELEDGMSVHGASQ
jgi:RND family efflux transporter MFP subunit